MLNHAPEPALPDAAQPAAGRAGWPVSLRFIVWWSAALVLICALAVGESLGWPFLARPLERAASAWMQRAVEIDSDDAADPGASALQVSHLRLATAQPARFGLQLLGALRVQAPRVRVAAPAWSHTLQLLVARDVAIELRYIDLWRAWRGQPLRIERLHIDTLELHLDRLADGRASWRAATAAVPTGPATQPLDDLPTFGHLQVAAGKLSLHDALADVDLQARLSLVDAASPLGSPWDATRVHGHGQALRGRQTQSPAPAGSAAGRAGSKVAGGTGDAPANARAPAKASAVATAPANTSANTSADTQADTQADTRAARRADTRTRTRPDAPTNAPALAQAAMAAQAASGLGGPPPGAALRDHEAARPASVMQLSATGWLRRLPVRIELLVGGSLPGPDTPGVARPMDVSLDASVGTAALNFDGQLRDPHTLDQLTGRFKLRGPSLAAVGDTVGVTLPSTAAFSTEGVVTRQGSHWTVSVADARIGVSRLSGEFVYEPVAGVPMLRGRLAGARLHLADLGPAIGTTALLPGPRVQRGSADPALAPVVAPGRVLPDRDFDLAALRVMDADVAVAIAEVDVGAGLLEPARPVRARLLLQGGVLKLRDIDARLGDGRLRGELQLDGRGPTALMATRLRWDGVSLDHWIHQHPADGAAPYVSGHLSGSASLTGQGGSTAEILASLNGSARTELRGGSVSHLAVEVAGLDLATSLGLLISGDKRLPIRCAVADLVAVDGVFRPRMMVFDTRASAIWVGGSLSLASETLDLRAVVSPRDFSLVALRTPLLVRGSFAHPVVSIDRGGIGRKLGTAALLALVNPLAALLPLVEVGSTSVATADQRSDGKGCAGLVVPDAVGRTPVGSATPLASGEVRTSGR